ncbi:uncharacterized protein BCR38DRAFT_415943 [Pseudomassariella vexata]|uniref:Mmc1 C-terminal domain-containing protein n=1 Tax=Pseudomassariella vexata TaxID=1141098 RepID=A0A1Y2EIP5_9PEZI|nr:uncharacterized protein BCR38DRAFT_415943 [Pseudomassariella vexata]ORY71106.1 hypothetical protein BCR38DRAFT_415943 [Pseudomassariella vexata]
MPPRMPLRPTGVSHAVLRKPAASRDQSVCLFCSLSRGSRPTPTLTPTRQPKRKALHHYRLESTVNTNATSDARKELEDALVALQKHAANYVNLSRVQLALNGLRQKPGTESVRVAILGLTNGSESGKTAKEVLKLLLADPLKSEEDWEREVEGHNLEQPMIVRVGAEEPQQLGTLSLTKGNLLHEVKVSSATLNGNSLEFLLMETNLCASAPEQGSLGGFEDSVLVPTVDIPTSSTGRYTPITTPVHKALIVADGIMGAASVASIPMLTTEGSVAAAVNLPEYKPTDESALPFTPVDVGTAGIGLGLIRRDLKDAMQYENLWFQSNIPRLVEWLKADVMSTADHVTKPPVRRLIASILQNAAASIEREETHRLSASLTAAAAGPTVARLKMGLADWAEFAHTELQEELDMAFASRRWRKLGWWKLFWRVDDVSMLTSDILNQRFLPASERSVIFLAGRMEEAGVSLSSSTSHPDMSPAESQSENGVTSTATPDPSAQAASGWPSNIPSTRAYLQNVTIPALQALAQKLVMQTFSTSGLTTSLGALAYFGTLTTGIYEAGAVAALGIIWSLRRMQKQWETAREYWEGEVREEGRKAVQGVERTVGRVLEQKSKGGGGSQEGREDIQDARDLVEKAREALERLE